ncbi:hypothetical protein M0811_09061 [Anaeramoeba ignava]|uniref:Transmembrane protein n=1 Tax=Anaeramoeba ignava TaxID=1746090 RepID=A0A9Q0RAJ3_ANAIG|nr:hypothetical protein M0811_09061 [Anaeramoeba ignava]
MKTTFIFLLLIFVSLVSAWDKNSYEISDEAYYTEYYTSYCTNQAYSGIASADVCYPVLHHDVYSISFDTTGYLRSYYSTDCTGSEKEVYFEPGECISLLDSGNLGSTFSVLLSLVIFFALQLNNPCQFDQKEEKTKKCQKIPNNAKKLKRKKILLHRIIFFFQNFLVIMKANFVFLLLIFVSLASAWDKNSFETSVNASVIEFYSSTCTNQAYVASLMAHTCYAVIDHNISSIMSNTSGYLYSYDSDNCTGSYTTNQITSGECFNFTNSGNLGSTFSVLLSLVSLLFSFFF